MSKRMKKPLSQGYSEAGASVERRALRGFIPASGSPNQDINDNELTLRQRSRMLYMASPVATSAINTNRTKVVGTGLTLKATVDREVLHLSPDAAKAWQTKVESEFRLWAEKKQNCDALGMNNFYALQQLAMKSWLMSGDCFALLVHEDATPLNPYTLRLRLIEADRICTPNTDTNILLSVTEGTNPKNGNPIYDGVEVNKNGKVVAYHICNTYPFQYTAKTAKWTRVKAVGTQTGMPNILHIMDAERPDQYRGVPYLAQVIEPLLQMRRYTESELMAALVQSFFTAWITTSADSTENPFNEVGDGIDGHDDRSPSDNEYEMGPGTVAHLDEGENITFGNPNIPTAGFDTFMKALSREVGAALEIPYDVLLKEFNSSYSASRAALLEAWEAFKMKRQWFVDDFCQPVYEAWLSEAVATGRINAPGFWDDPLVRHAWCQSHWIGPIQGQLDPLKEANAAVTLIQNGIKTHEQVTREMGGGNWESNVNQLADENKKLNEANQASYEANPKGEVTDEEM